MSQHWVTPERGRPVWLGEQSAVCRMIVERLYGTSGELNGKFVLDLKAGAAAREVVPAHHEEGIGASGNDTADVVAFFPPLEIYEIVLSVGAFG